MFGFDHWLSRSKKGDVFATSLMWYFLAADVRKRTLSDAQWTVLARLIDAIADEKSPRLLAAANGALSIGRRRGAKPQYRVEEDSFALARDVFDLAGEVRGAALDAACERILLERRGYSTAPPDLRACRKAYRTHLSYFLELRRLEGENESPADGAENSA